jgi:hypothetical protein
LGSFTDAQDRDRGEVDNGNATSANAEAGKACHELTPLGEEKSWLTRQDKLDKPKQKDWRVKGESARCGICPR